MCDVGKDMLLVSFIGWTALASVASCLESDPSATNRTFEAQAWSSGIGLDSCCRVSAFGADDGLVPFDSVWCSVDWGLPMGLRRDAPTGLFFVIR